MIEIICNENDEHKGENVKAGKSTVIRRPKNIKQIGDVSSDKKIYIEDYAYTYINSVAYADTQEEQAGVLLGECQKSDEEKCLFIKGVIKARNTEVNPKQGIYFDEKIWTNIYSDIEKYFPNLQVVGWFASVPSVTDERMRYLKRIHLDNFAGNMKTMYLIDTSDKEAYFYLYENGDLKKQKGYVCFYERNYEMQEYMLEKRGSKSIEEPDKDTVVKNIRSIIQEKEDMRIHKRNAAFMYSLSTFMIVVVLVIGINLMNSYEKMNNFDKSLNSIVTEISNIGANKDDEKNDKNVSSNDVVSVNKVAGNVYPVQEEQSGSKTLPGNEQKEDNKEQVSGEQDNNNGNSGNSNTENPTKAEESGQSIAQSQTQPQTEPEKKEPYNYKVKEGDTVISICKKYYGTASKYDEVVAYNNIPDPDKLYIGQNIKLP